MLASLFSKSFKLGFSNMWTNNFQRYKLELEKAEESEIKLLTFVGSWRKQANSRKTSASLTTLKPLTVWIKTNCGKFLKRWENQMALSVLWETSKAGQEAKVRIRHGTTDWVTFLQRRETQGFTLCLLHWQAYSLPLSHPTDGQKAHEKNRNSTNY